MFKRFMELLGCRQVWVVHTLTKWQDGNLTGFWKAVGEYDTEKDAYMAGRMEHGATYIETEWRFGK